MDRTLSNRGGPSAGRSLFPVAAASFLLGGAAVGLMLWGAERNKPPQEVARSAPTVTNAAGPAGTPSPLASQRPVPLTATQVVEQQGGLEQRLAAAEQRLARLDLQAEAAAGNASRAEGLLIAFASRRALEKGAELGYLGDQLQLRFGDTMPNAVRTIITASIDPVTLDQLIARLDGLSPHLAEHADKPALERFGEELAQLFTIRRETAPSPQPEQRLERARLFLESGRVEAAIAEMSNMPGAARADGWVRDAQRYADVQAALDLIETAAVLEPRRLRDAAGNRINQPSPAQAR